ncbi:MAG: TRAP transporter TatT component family protein [Treponema sp.]|jgi:predicted anti-sigma-YlaC factor YlaD|nr:TRAP transporter TatT component family protein [Treponema sp.]
MGIKQRGGGLFFLWTLTLPLAGCSINRLAMRAVADALTAPGGGAVFTSDTDPKLVGDALPFAIKLYESLLAEQPGHRGLILTTGSLFVMYANAFVQAPADALPASRFQERQDGIERAKGLYIRGADMLLNGMEARYKGFAKASREGLEPYLAKTKKDDVPFLYWMAAGYLSAFSLDPLNAELGRRVPDLLAYIGRAYALDPDFNRGALDEFYSIAYASLPPGLGGNLERAAMHFKRALAKSGGTLAGPYVSYAQSAAVPAQDYGAFTACLEAALAVDVNADPANRLANTLAQEKARVLLARRGDYFFLNEDGELDREAYAE